MPIRLRLFKSCSNRSGLSPQEAKSFGRRGQAPPTGRTGSKGTRQLSDTAIAAVWMHKLRRAMVLPDRELLWGTVEVDEAFIGGITRGTAGRGRIRPPS